MGIMRAGSAFFLAATVFAGAVSAELKIGYINSIAIFNAFEATKEAQDKFNKEVAKWEQEASAMQKEMKELKEQLENQSLLLSSAKKKELQDKLQEKMIAYQKFLQTKFGQRGEALSKNEELTKPIVDKINKIIDRIAKEEKYDFIFDVKAGGVVFSKTRYDLTDRVIAILNKGE